jgi:sugar/nucleoside kinase (ribokinase family)
LTLLHFTHAYEVLTISDSIVDYILYVDEEFTATLPGQKGGSSLVDHLSFQDILNQSQVIPVVRPGASAVNVLKGLQILGNQCGLITTIGKDPEGEFFLKSLHERGIQPLLAYSSIPTGKSACLVTPSKERTMRTFLGASRENGNLKLNSETFTGISHFHIEGYQLQHHQLVKEAIALAKKNNATISIDFSSFEVVKGNKKFIWKLLKENAIDILFANQEEALALTGLAPKQSSEMLSNYCNLTVITMGENGCYVNQGPYQWHCPAIPVEAIDTIGAGDLFISGFLHGFLNNEPTPVCACTGTLLASHVVQSIGAEIPQEQWTQIKALIAQPHWYDFLIPK